MGTKERIRSGKGACNKWTDKWVEWLVAGVMHLWADDRSMRMTPLVAGARTSVTLTLPHETALDIASFNGDGG
eukprot:1160720-Pelagomonas_calceolata.AAC.7